MSTLAPQPPVSRAAASRLYRKDGHAWAKQQAAALRRRDYERIDWENVIEEIEAMGRAERKPWVTNCARALEHMLAIEHCKGATPGEARHWRDEVGAFRIEMAAAIDASHSLQGEYDEILALAWKQGRALGIRRLAKYAATSAGADDARPFQRAVKAQLPADCPYLVDHVTAYDPKRDDMPRDDIWPPAIAVRLNTLLGTRYEILDDRQRGYERSR